MTARVIGIAGWKNAGKTTLVEKLVAELGRRGHVVSTVKHTHHDVKLDRPGSDSDRHRSAGARETAIVSGRRWAVTGEWSGDVEPSTQAAVALLGPCDIVLVEGDKFGPHAKIECRRREAADGAPGGAGFVNVVAIAADHPVPDAEVPVYALDDVAGVADLIETATGLAPRRGR